MEQRRINMSDIALGAALPWDVTDSAGHLLLKKGLVVQREHQLEGLIERGLFIDAIHATAGKKEINPTVLQEPPSVLRMINQAEKRLERLLFNLNNELDLQRKLVEIAKLIQFAVSSNRDVALATILLNQASGPYPVRHGVDTAIAAVLMARRLRQPAEQIIIIASAALTMNLGMLRQQEHFQSKTEVLTDAEQQVIHHHPEESVRLLREVGITDEDWLNIILLHHENENGSGYPFGKVGADLHQHVKVIAIADRYCARVSARDYRKPMLPNAALRDILTHEKDHLDPGLVATFIHEIGIYPCGMFVRLQNGEVGVVSGKGASSTLPIVHALIGPRGAPLAFPIKRDTGKTLMAVREAVSAEAATMRFSMQQVWGGEAKL